MSDTADQPRLAPPTDLPEEVLADLAKTRIGDGPPPLLFQTLAHHPRLMRRTNALGGLFMRSEHLDARSRELVILRVAWRTGCGYELAHHRPLGRAAGLSDAEVAAVTGGEVATLGEDDQWLVALADELDADAQLSDDTYAALAARWPTEALLELLALAGFYRLLAGVLQSLQVPIDPWLEADGST